MSKKNREEIEKKYFGELQFPKDRPAFKFDEALRKAAEDAKKAIELEEKYARQS